jgi:hypothetical protein
MAYRKQYRQRKVRRDRSRDKFVERCKHRAFDYFDRGEPKNAVASFVGDMSARLDCELPHYLAGLAF